MWMVLAWREIHIVLFKPWKKREVSKAKSGNLLLKKKKYPKTSKHSMKHFLNETSQKLMSNSLSTKTLANEQYDLCENNICETDLFDSMKSMKNNKNPGNDGLTKEISETFWEELKTPFMESINQVFHTLILSISQRQAVIKLNEKKDRDKCYIKNWRPISLLNVETKILSKAISNKLKLFCLC